MIKALVALLLVSASTAYAGNITVLNADFEAQPQADGGFTNNSITNWVGSAQAAFSFGVFNPNNNYISGTSSPNSNHTAYINGGSISQLLSTTVTANTVYTLSVDVFDRKDVGFPGYSVELLAGNNVLATGALVSPNDGFLTSIATYTADNTYVGQLLSIRLSTSGVQTNFDNVSLNAVAAVPESNTYAMLLAGIGMLGFVVKRKNQA